MLWLAACALAAPAAEPARADGWLYSSDLSADFAQWCASGTGLVGPATAKYRELHAEAGAGIANVTRALELVNSELASLDRAALPQSSDPEAGVLAAIEAMETAFTPEVAELKLQKLQLSTLLSSYQADFDDSEVLVRTGDLLLGQLAKAERMEKNLAKEVEFALKTPALLAKRQEARRVAPSQVQRRSLLRHTAVAQLELLHAESPLEVLKAMGRKLDQRKEECASHLAANEQIRQEAAQAEQELVVETASALQRMQDTAAVLKEYGAYRSALSALGADGDKLFGQERVLYSTEVEHVAGQPDNAMAMKVCDTAHSFWMEWRDGISGASGSIVKYLDTRHGQLENMLASQEYLRPDKSPHLAWSKEGPPVGLHCPSDAEYASRKQKISEAVAALTTAFSDIEDQRHFEQFGPGLLKSKYDDKCLDYNYNNGNVYMHNCHRESNQRWQIGDRGELKSQHDNKCLDYNYNNGNVYMHDCHHESNQRWRIDPSSGAFQSDYDNKCLDYNYNDGNVYMHDCHYESNQNFYFERA